MENAFGELAARIRELREICGYSLGDLAAELRLEPETLRRYESEGADVPISVLYQMSHLFGVDFNELISGQQAHLDTLSVVRRGAGHAVDRYPGYRFQALASTYKRKLMEPLLVTVMPDDKPVKLVQHPGQEFNLVLEGEIELLFDDKRVTLSAGDSVYFNPVHPHGQKAIGGKARFLTVIAE
jgi:transcriptional regulator with XRE-family HTH domain